MILAGECGMVMLYLIIVYRNRLHPAGNQLIGKLLVDAAYHTVSCRLANNTAAVVREPQDIKLYEGIERVLYLRVWLDVH